MKLLDSRRLTGPNLIWDHPGAILDVSVPEGMPEATVEAAIEGWSRRARQLLDAVGWDTHETAARRYPRGFSLALGAPVDALYSAVDLAEHAWHGLADGFPEPEDHVVDHLKARVEDESDPRLAALRWAAYRQRVSLRADAEAVTAGMGARSKTWAMGALPEPEEVDWEALGDVPLALVTGTNGKSTTVRLVAAMAAAGGHTVGQSSTEWVKVGDEVLDQGDWSGPGGARMALADRRVTLAVLETARGGMLRRGLAVDFADVAAITNIAEDHLGDFGLPDLSALADLKLVVARVAETLVLNADDALSMARAAGLENRLILFGLDPAAPAMAAHLAAGGEAAVLEGEALVLLNAPRPREPREVLGTVAALPIALGGAARYNIANALCAAAVAARLGVDTAAIGEGLRSFQNDPDTNPGRLNRFDVGGRTIVVDYAHNPHGMRAVLDAVAHIPAERRLVAIGQAGDRDDRAIRELARLAMTLAPDRVIVKELPSHLRGRALGEVPAILAGELGRLGLAEADIGHSEDDLGAARDALAWGRPGDLLVLFVHARRDEVLALLRDAAAEQAEPA